MGLGIFRGGMEAEGASSTTGKLAELRQQDEELETGASARSGGRGRCRAGPPRMDPATNEAHKKLWMGWVEGERRPLLAPLGMRPKIISSNKFKDTTHKRFYRPTILHKIIRNGKERGKQSGSSSIRFSIFQEKTDNQTYAQVLNIPRAVRCSSCSSPGLLRLADKRQPSSAAFPRLAQFSRSETRDPLQGFETDCPHRPATDAATRTWTRVSEQAPIESRSEGATKTRRPWCSASSF